MATSPATWPKWDQSQVSHLHPVTAIIDDFIPTQQARPGINLYIIINISRFSTLKQLLTVTTYAYRFLHNSCNPLIPQKGPITAQELHQARMEWIHGSQN